MKTYVLLPYATIYYEHYCHILNLQGLKWMPRMIWNELAYYQAESL